MSGAPIRVGTYKFPNPLITGIIIKRIIKGHEPIPRLIKLMISTKTLVLDLANFIHISTAEVYLPPHIVVKSLQHTKKVQ